MDRTQRQKRDNFENDTGGGPTNEIRGKSLGGQRAQRPQQPIAGGLNLPDIQTPKVQQAGTTKQNELRESFQKSANVIQIARSNDPTGQQLSNQGGGQFKNPNMVNNSQNLKILPNINISSPRKQDPGYDYISLGARIQDQMKNYNTTGTGKQQHQRHLKNSSVQPLGSRGGIGSREQLMTPTNNDITQGQLMQFAGAGPKTTTFENYITKVIKSVERRKQKPTAVNNQTQRLAGLMELDYNNPSLGSKKSSKHGNQALNNTTIFQNFSNQIVVQNSQQIQSQNALMELQKQSYSLQKSGTLKSQGSNQIAIIENSRDDSSFVEVRGPGSQGILKKSSKGYDSIYGSAINQQQVALIGYQSVFQEPKATEQVAFLLKEAKKKDKIFIPLEKSTDFSSGYMYKEMKHAPENHAGVVVFSKQGFVTVGKERNQTSDFISNEEFIQNGVNRYILKDIPFFKKFQAMRIFKQWKYIMRWNLYSRKRRQLAENLHLTKPIFSEKFLGLVMAVNTIRTLPFMEIKQNSIYGKKQQALLDEKCQEKLDSSKVELEGLLNNIKDTLKKLKREIEDDDKNFEKSVKESRVQALIKMNKNGEQLVMFSKARRQKEIEEEQYRIQKLRHSLFDKHVEMMLKFICSNLIELLYENKRIFKDVFKDVKNGPQFEVSICFNPKGKLDTDPSMEDHHSSFLLIFENMEKSVYQNQSLIQFITDIVGLMFREKPIYYKALFEHMKQRLVDKEIHKVNHEQIFETLQRDIERCRNYLQQFISLQEIYDFAKNWENINVSNKNSMMFNKMSQGESKDKQVSLEMGFYKETWLQMDKYNDMIDKIPQGNTKLGTILVETLSLKKYLAELPKKVIDSMRHNVTLTMENETKSLREELSKTSEILDQLPTSLNVYVEQVNTIKYVKEKQEEFSQKFQTINKLHQLCKQDNIKVSLTLQLAIEEVSHLYESLPKLQKSAAEGLNQNKDTMEKIMQSSSLVLSKKIKAFEKKYVETYLQDRSRIEDCADTLEELFKRSKAIHEIRSKVILYKEFLKLLYEDDPNKEEKLKLNKLQCSDDYEFVSEVHKETIKLWKMLLYWRKRRQMCYNTPFLQLDSNKIIRSINKVNRYLEEKLSKNEFLRDKSRPLCKVVVLQVKETSLIIEFLKELRRESLQQRHWIQIFNLIKAPHLKNSNSFTIVNLREYHIQNYREEIQQIIEHANTELKYEKIYKAIKEEWEQLELKIIPYKETMDSYILVNTDTLSSTIEENLTTLETICQSKYAIHVKADIDEWIKTLKSMLKNLEIWVNAQKHWINLDPIFQSTSLHDILGQDTNEFQDLRNQFKRIMWSTFKNPKATYNLMIANRIEVFENLIKHFSVLQKKVNEYLEQRRLAFPRFFFLTDSQFLDFLTLANSNQDFNDYVNAMFQGAHKFYINRILGQRKDLGQIEDYISSAFKMLEDDKTPDKKALTFQTQNAIKTQDNANDKRIYPYLNTAAKNMLFQDNEPTIEVNSPSVNESYNQNIPDHNDLTPNQLKVDQKDKGIGGELGTKLGQINAPSPDAGFQVLGMISQNKELFLFERPVPMKDGVEKWLIKVEESMQETVAKMINYAVSSFPNQSLDEWILDYPQQVIITTIHLILSHEVNELLEELNTSDDKNGLYENNTFKDDDQDEDEDDSLSDSDSDILSNSTSNMNAIKEKKQSKRSNLSSAGHRTFSKKSHEDDEDAAMKEYLKKRNELKAQLQAEEEEEKRKIQEEMRQKLEANELPRDPQREKRKLINEMFGRDFPLNSKILKEEDKVAIPPLNVADKEENKSVITDKEKITPAPEKKPEFKDFVMGLLQKKSFQGLYLRLQFWVNQIIKSLCGYNNPLKPLNEQPQIQLHSVQQMVMKSLISFLLFQRDVVDNLMKKNVKDVNDFEWQSQIRLLWTGIEPGCRVDCGGWSTYQQNEYLGSQPRLTLTPLTNRYFIFVSAALREKSAVLLKCAPSHQNAGDIFEEFSNICSVPFKQLQCNTQVQMKSLMQYLNGATLASVWVFFEHLDKLPYIQLQTFNKEIQMVQQQFIIAELSGQDIRNVTQDDKATNQHSVIVQKGMHIQKNKTSNLDSNLYFGIDQSTTQNKILSNITSIKNNAQKTEDQKSFARLSQKNKNQNQEMKQPFTKTSKVCFGVFGSISHSFMINHHYLADEVLHHVQSAFRSLALTRPNELHVFKIVLKAQGFTNYESLSKLSQQYIELFYLMKQDLIDQALKQSINNQKTTSIGKTPQSATNMLQHQFQIHEQFNLKDIKLIAKLASLLMTQDLLAFSLKIHKEKESRQTRDLLGQQKTREQKIEDNQREDYEQMHIQTEVLKIEQTAMQEAIKMVTRQRFSHNWREITAQSLKGDQMGEGGDQEEVDQSLERVIEECMNKTFGSPDSYSEETRTKGLTEEQKSLVRNAGMRRKSISNTDVFRKYSSSSGLSSLMHQLDKIQQEKSFIDLITKSMKEISERLSYDKVNSQLRNCVKMIELMRRFKGIALVGPTCTGKTSILKIVSNVLNITFGVKMRTSVVNPTNFTRDELYGPISTFNQKATSDNAKNNDATQNSFSKGGIFQIILDVLEKEMMALSYKERSQCIQSIFFDSDEINYVLSECLLQFLSLSNKREGEYSSQEQFLMDLSSGNKINDGLYDHISVTLPNSNVIRFPRDLYLFFETNNLKNTSPQFISRIGLIITEEDDLSWLNICHRHMTLFLKKNKKFFEENKLDMEPHVKECFNDFLEPFIEKIHTQPKIQTWIYYNSKSSIAQFFTLLNATFTRMAEVIKERNTDEDSHLGMMQESVREVVWSSILQCIIWSFGAILNKDLRKVFEEQFFNYRRKFNINIGGPSRQRFTLFDIFFDPESLQWDLLQEKLEYKLKLQYDPVNNILLIPCVEVSQSYFMMDILLGSLKSDDQLDKHFRILGPSATSKSIALTTFMKRYSDQYNQVIVPMSAYLTINKLKQTVESHYNARRRNLLEPLDKDKRVVLMIDDLHLQTNLQTNVLEFLRTWCMSKGYYDIEKGFFKNIGQFGTIMAENSEYRRSYCKFDERKPLESRFLFNTNTLYIDEYDFDKYKLFVQHWLTSKMWNTSKLINKYYILITNSIMVLLEKIKRQEYFHNTSMLRLTSFHFFARFCANLANYTLISDDPQEITIKGLKEEDSAANMMIYELLRNYADRIVMPNYRTTLVQRVLDSCKQEFVSGNHLSTQYIDQLLLGNYNERRQGAHIKYLYMNDRISSVKDHLRQLIKSCSNNHFLESFLDAPNGLKEIFRLSRILFKEMQHLILVGHPGCGKHEYLQLAAILNEGLIFELNVARFGEPLKFAQVFKHAVISAVSLNQFSYILINDSQLKDPVYIDFAYNFIVNICMKETTILMDEDFKNALIEIEIDLMRNSNNQSTRKTVEPNKEILFLQAMRKIQKNVHIVFMINEFQTYFEWVSLFPGLESRCEVIYMDELSVEGYKQLTSEFFTQRDTDNATLTDQKLIKSLVEMRQIVKNKILQTFYSQSMLQCTTNEDYMITQAGEYIFSLDQKLHGFMYANGNFSVNDPQFKQLNYNLPVEVCSVYKTRYVMFLELFRFMYDYLSLNLVIRRNYYETFLRKSSEFSEFFKDIKSAKSQLHNESHQITYKLASLKDKINKIQQIITEKDQNIQRRQKDIGDLELELKNNRDELNSVIFEKDQMINEILSHLEKINGSEFSYVISTSNYKQNEQNLLDILAMIISQNSKIKNYSKNDYDIYFLNREELINLLDDRRDYDYDQPCFNLLKDFINLYTANDFRSKPLFKQLFNYMMELYRKLNVRNTMANAYTRIKEIKEQIDSNYFSINYSKQFIDDKREEMDSLKAKYEHIQDQESSLCRRIEEAEISHMRTEHIFLQVEKYSNKIYGKLTDIKKRIDTLLGDCIILAASVVYLGVFSIKERLTIRKEMFDYINNGCGIKCSSCWSETSLTVNNHGKLFKQIIKEYGLRKPILSHNLSGIMSQPTVIEGLFTMIFAPSCPYIVDPTGQLQEFVIKNLMNNHQIKKLYASDQGINQKIEQVYRSQTFALLNDLNDASKERYGLCQEEPLLHRLSHITHNGYDFDYERLSKLKSLHTLSSFHNSFSSANKRLPSASHENLSLYQLHIVTPRFDFTLDKDYMARTTMFVAVDSDTEIINGSNIQAAWIEVKELMLKHFIPEEHKKMLNLKDKIKHEELRQSQLNKNFENAFLIANQETLQKINEYSLLKQSVEDIRHSQEERLLYKKQLQELLNENPLLSSYSNVISIMYLSLKKLSKISSEITYSWKMYLEIIDQILAKIVRDLNSNLLQKPSQKNENSSESISVDTHVNALAKSRTALSQQQLNKSQLGTKEFTIDEDFFSNIIVPSVYATIISGIKQHLVPLYNLILSIKIAYKKKEITEGELEFFLKQLFLLKDFHKWRSTEHEFIDLDAKIEKTKFYAFKREILKIYPEQGRKIMEFIEKEIGQTFVFKNASLTLHGKAFNQHQDFKNFTLMQKINIGFLCPDHEFKSKICQLVYEELSSVFAFNEELIKLHHFIKTASWTYPISLFSQKSINIINTVCSIASYYGLGLEVLRTDLPNNLNDYQQERKNLNVELNQQIRTQLKDYNSHDINDYIASYRLRLNKEAVLLDTQAPQTTTSGCISKFNLELVQQKEQLAIEEKGMGGGSQSDQNPLMMIEQCALAGSWVFISTLRFPSFWHKMIAMLDQLRQQNKIQNTFRVFFDLQGYQQNEIPDSFLFDNSISFYLTDTNNEDMEGFNDIWTSILNDKILTELTNYDNRMMNEFQVEDQETHRENFSDGRNNSSLMIHSRGTQRTKRPDIKPLEQFIQDEKQRDLYKEFFKNQKLEESKNSNTLLFGSDPTEELKNQKTSKQRNFKVQQDHGDLQQFNLIEHNLNDFLSDVNSIGTSSLKNNDLAGRDANLSKDTFYDNDKLTENQGEDVQLQNRDKDDQAKPKYSRINSANQSVDLSRGENALIQEVQSQYGSEGPTGGPVGMRQSSKVITSNNEQEKSEFHDNQRSADDIGTRRKSTNMNEGQRAQITDNDLVSEALNDEEEKYAVDKRNVGRSTDKLEQDNNNKNNAFDEFNGDGQQQSQNKYDNTSELSDDKRSQKSKI